MKIFQKLPAPYSLSRVSCPPDAVLQFHYAHYRKRNLLRPGDFPNCGQHIFDRQLPAFDRDCNTGIEDQSHAGLSGSR